MQQTCLAITIVLFASFLVVFLRPVANVARAVGGVTQDQATKAASLMKEWAIWLAAISTGILVAVLALYGGNDVFPGLALGAIIFLSLSILAETVLLAGLPSVVLRLVQPPSPSNDIYEARLFTFIPIRTGAVYLAAHIWFAAGAILIAVQFVLYGVPALPGK